MKNDAFVHLHVHSEYSLLDGACRIDRLFDHLKAMGQTACAITDHGVAQAFPDAWHTAKGKIKILYGVEGYFVNNLDDRIAVHGPQDQAFSDEIVCFDIETTGLKVTREAITEIGKDYVVNEGDGAFYGPKLDFHLADSIGRTWQCGTIQLDMQLPERFELEYTGADGEKHRPVMIHRVVLGSIERFIGVITEHFAGAFPTWLAPEQVRVMPMTDRNIPCAQEVMKQLTDKGFRATMDDRNEKIGYKIREAQVHKVPYMIVIGDKDEEKGIISVRNRKTGETTPMELGEFIEKLDYEVKNKLK